MTYWPDIDVNISEFKIHKQKHAEARSFVRLNFDGVWYAIQVYRGSAFHFSVTDEDIKRNMIPLINSIAKDIKQHYKKTGLSDIMGNPFEIIDELQISEEERLNLINNDLNRQPD